MLLLMVVSCSKEDNSMVESQGFDFDHSTFFVDAISLDSMSFASGKKQWLLQGLIVTEGVEYPYSMIFAQNPISSEVEPVIFSPPGCFHAKETVETRLTKHGKNIKVSWRTKDRYLCVRTVLTSAR